MSDDQMSDAAKEFPLQPSGPDWDRLTAVVQNMERRKTAGLPAREALRDLVDVSVISFIAATRASSVANNHDETVRLADSWAEGFLFGVLFEQAGGTAHEHEPVMEKTALSDAMRPPAMPAQSWPKVPDSATMLLVIDEVEARFASDMATEGVYNEIVDVFAMVYLAANRVGLSFPSIDVPGATRAVDSWVEGFLYGVLFQRAGGTVGVA